MDLSSLTFLFLFLPIFLGAYLVARKEMRLWLIVLAGLVFLAWGKSTAALWLGFVLLVSYGIGLFLPGAKGGKRPFWLWLGLGTNLLLLAVFKFLLAYGSRLQAGLHLSGLWADLVKTPVVPLGLSYVTFQAVSYLVDVWRGTIPPERNLLRFSAYLLFFPKLVSGPLMRYEPFNDQALDPNPSFDAIADGSVDCLWGLSNAP
jgi:alginate O-acetyltransferase complex protein AlgI